MREEMKSEIIHDAIGFLDDEMIEEVDALRTGVVLETIENDRKKLVSWRKWGVLAASIAVILIAGNILMGEGSNSLIPEQESAADKLMEDSNSDDQMMNIPESDVIESTEETETER